MDAFSARTEGSTMRTFLLATTVAMLVGQGGVTLPAGIAGDFSDWVKTGLLGAVLAWLMLKHLPSKDAQLEKLLADHRVERQDAEAKCTQNRTETNREFLGALQKQQLEFHAMLTLMLASNDKTHSAVTAVVSNEVASLKASVVQILEWAAGKQ